MLRPFRRQTRRVTNRSLFGMHVRVAAGCTLIVHGCWGTVSSMHVDAEGTMDVVASSFTVGKHGLHVAGTMTIHGGCCQLTQMPIHVLPGAHLSVFNATLKSQTRPVAIVHSSGTLLLANVVFLVANDVAPPLTPPCLVEAEDPCTVSFASTVDASNTPSHNLCRSLPRELPTFTSSRHTTPPPPPGVRIDDSDTTHVVAASGSILGTFTKCHHL